MKPEIKAQPADIHCLIDQAAPYIDDTWRRLMPIINPSDWKGLEAPVREWLLEHWIPLKQATYLTGPGSAGKSLLAQLLCTCVALGLPFLGIQTRQEVAMYVTCEDDRDELHRRQAAICEALGVDLSDLDGKLILVSLVGQAGSELATFKTPSGPDELGSVDAIIRPTQQYRALEGTALAYGVGFIALDNVAHLYAGNENIRNEVAAFVSLLNRLAIRTSGAVLLIGHPNKAGDAFSGSTAWENQVRSRLYMETPKDDHGIAPDPDARVLSRDKANYARNGEKISFRWHRWTFVRDEDLPADHRVEIAANVQASSDNAVFLNCLRERIRQRRAVSEKRSPTYAPTEFAKMAEAKGLSKFRLEAAMDRLFRTGAIERAELWKDVDRKPVFGLRETAGNGAVNTVQETRATVAPALCGGRGQHTHHSTTYYTGAAHEAAPPDSKLMPDSAGDGE
ncbi:AAA family ATPase [Sphingosinicella sp. LY1275]|uniref:AAA family ATPase n=1 Tax=Sphingosinicella sp. LY1275 TaxID=3095379 RepID=UPI002ADEE5C0|nr:AAA family ATPase [Sphingosinicella sp. LY1275]MEA1015599.1 AAA family ATPase [Sphingosinicella sp. LY1275]